MLPRPVGEEPERGLPEPRGDASRLVRDEPDGDESGSGVCAGSIRPNEDGPGVVLYWGAELKLLYEGCMPLGDCGGDPSVEERPPVTEAEKCTFFEISAAAVAGERLRSW